MRSLRFLLFLFFFTTSTGLFAEVGPAFDLSGPKVDVHVKRGDVTLPISEAANLLPGDRLWIHPDLPESQSTRFVLVVVFLRGSTNPPPPEWFTRVETWTREAREEGVFVTVPAEAQQAVLFLAPETGGDFNTLRGAVRGRPGSFVRAAQDLQAASWERMRLEAYLSDVKMTSQTDPKSLKDRAELAARSLGIKLNQDCFNRPIDQQATCLSQNSEGLVLDDANIQSRVDQLTSGSTADLMNQLSYSSMAGGGIYSAYVGAVVDTARILSSLHTAHFQYIPALALPTADTLNLRLNMPPSFRNPKSVVVVALPPIGPPKSEPLHPVNPSDTFCAYKPTLALPAEGAPLIFATQLAHDLVLHIEPAAGQKSAPVNVPLKAEAGLGGLVPVGKVPPLPPGELTGEVRGKWGFADWTGPRFHLYSPESGKWSLAAADQSALVVGRDDTVHLEGQSSLCVDKVEGLSAEGKPADLTWKSPKPDTLEVSLNLNDAAPGLVKVAVYQHGLDKPDEVKMTAYDAAASLDNLSLSAGDSGALLKGTRLDEVANARFEGISFSPVALTHVDDFDQLMMSAGSSTAGLKPGKSYTARVELKDGRELKTTVRVDPPRPQIALLSKGVQDGAGAKPLPVQFGSPDDLPVDGRLVFFLKSTSPASFPRTEKVEVAAADSSFRTLLDLADGSLMLEDAKTAVGTLEPLSRFGSSAFGPVHIRAVAADGTTGDWLPLGTLVRMPGFKELRCPRAASKPCLLTGNNLFLADSIASTPDFESSTDVPAEFTGTQLTVPHPVNGMLYVKLRDDPATVQTLTLPVTPVSAPVESAAIKARAQTATQPAAGDSTQPATEPSPTQPQAQPEATPQTSTSQPQAPETEAAPNAAAGLGRPGSNDVGKSVKSPPDSSGGADQTKSPQ
ncbi:MAG TPA: hypothetical protein VHD85_06140 [Terracidiphilus sp.]|nr:hypothetical protein [Terracidiphilus sp.]